MTRKNIILGLLTASLISVGVLINSEQGVAQNPNPGSAPVNIVSPLPLPVTGTVSGTVQIAGTVPVRDASETVLVFNQTKPVALGAVDVLGPIDVSSFREVRVATRLVAGAAADLLVVPALSMTGGALESIAIAQISSANGTVVLDIPGRTMFIRLIATNPVTAQIQVYGRQ